MDIEKFEELVSEGIEAIPEKFLKRLENVEIIVEERPTLEQLKKLKIRKNALLFGLYEGVPQTKRWGYGQVLPDKITIFKEPIEKASRSKEDIKKLVKETVWHEIAHHFGFSEKRVREVEAKKRKLK